MNIISTSPQNVARRLAPCTAVVGFGQFAFLGLAPLLMDHAAISTATIGIAVALGAVGFLVGAPAFAALASAHGKANVLRALGLVLVAAQAVLALLILSPAAVGSMAPILLLASRLLYGFAAAGVNPIAQGWVAEVTRLEERPAGFATLSAGINGGRILGSLSMTLAALHPAVPLVLLILSPFVLLSLRESEPSGKHHRHEKRGNRPFRLAFLPCLAIGFCATFGLGAVQVMLGPFLQQIQRLDAQAAAGMTGVVLTAAALVMLATQLLVIPRLKSLRPVHALQGGGLATLVAMAILGLSEQALVVIAAYCLMAAGMAFLSPAYMSLLAARAVAKEQMTAAGWLASIHVIGQSLGALAGGLVYEVSPVFPFIICGLAAVAVMVIAPFAAGSPDDVRPAA